MRKRKLITALTALLTTSSLLVTACGNSNVNKTAEGTNGTTQQAATESKMEFADKFPEHPKAVDPSSYKYDDMSKKYDIEIMLPGVFNQPIPDDKIKQYLDQKFNVNVKLTALTSADLLNKVATRFSSGDIPDFIVMPDKNVALKLFQQGQLADATQILPYMPQASQYITKDFAKWASYNGKMIGVPRYPTFPNNWGYFIRTDWLKELNMKKPTTEDELFAYAKAVHDDLSKKDGKQHWFMGTAGGGNGWGMMAGLEAMFGDPSWNVVDGKINNPMLDGTTKKYLQFVKKLYDNKLLVPDWYTQAWEPFKSYTFNDQVGMVWYPGWNIIDETYNATNHNMDKLADWEAVEPFKSNDGKGGMYPAGDTPGGLFLFPKKVADDKGKLMRITHMVDSFIYPNENYWAVSQGGGPEVFKDGSKVTMNSDGTNVFFIDKTKHPAYTDPKYQSEPDWQSVGYTLLYQVYDDPVGKIGSKWNSFMEQQPRYKNYDIFLNLDGPTVTKLNDFQNKNEIQFVLGKRSFDDWDKYVQEWQNAGGKKLMDEAAKQLNAK